MKNPRSNPTALLTFCTLVLSPLALVDRSEGQVPARVEINIDRPEGTYVVSSLSCAYAVAMHNTTNPCGGFCSGGDADGVNCGSSSGAYADFPGCPLTCECPPYTFIFCDYAPFGHASASASPPGLPGSGPEIVIETLISRDNPCRQMDPRCTASGVAVALAGVPVYQFELAQASARSFKSLPGWTGVVDVTIPSISEFDEQFEFEGLVRRGVVTRGAPSGDVALYLLWNDDYSTGIGLTFNGVDWTGQAVIAGGLGVNELDNIGFLFDDGSMDVDGNGRFNQEDVDVLPIGSTDLDDLERWDFDQSGVIDVADADVMQDLVDAGVDSGIFGDLDDDGEICLADQDAILLLEGITLESTEYTTRADYNLDGIINSIDLQAFDDLFRAQSDCNCNGINDAQDILDCTSCDRDVNGFPDECEMVPDCTGACTENFGCSDCDVCTCDYCVDGECEFTPGIYGDVDCNGVLNLWDIFCVLDGFSGIFDRCQFEDVDIEPCAGNGVINLFDLYAVLDAFSGIDPCCGGQ